MLFLSGIPAFISIELQVKAEGKYLYKMTNGLDPKIENFLNCISSDKKRDVILPDEIFSSTSKINISHFYYDPKTSGYGMYKILLHHNVAINVLAQMDHLLFFVVC